MKTPGLETLSEGDGGRAFAPRDIASWLEFGEFSISTSAIPAWVEDLHEGRYIQDWVVELTVHDESDRLPEGRYLDEDRVLDRGGSDSVVLFQMSGVLVDPRLDDLAFVLDRRDIDIYQFFGLIDSEDLDDSDLLLIIDRAVVADPLRGHGGIGRLLIHEGIKAIGLGRPGILTAVLPFPYMLDNHTRGHRRATRRVWESMDFHRFDQKIWIRNAYMTSPQCEARAKRLLG